MIRIGLTYDGKGIFSVVSKHGLEQVMETFKAGEVVNAELRRPRSVSQNNLFHALVEAAFDNQRTGPKFETWRHLKSWLLIRAGYCDEYHVEDDALSPAMANIFRQRFDFIEIVRVRGDGIVVRFAQSMSFDAMEHEAATDALNKVIEIIADKIVPGVDREELMKMGREEAK